MNVTEVCKKEIYVEDGSKVISGTLIGLNEKGKEIYSSKIGVVQEINGSLYVLGEEVSLDCKTGSEFYGKEGEIFPKGQTILNYDSHNNLIVAESEGIIKFVDFIFDVNIVKTEAGQLKVKQLKSDKNQPIINIVDKDDPEKVLQTYHAVPGSVISVEDGQEVKVGEIIIKIPKGKTTQVDIVSGLPRVNNLFEARLPKNKAILAVVDGKVIFGEVKRTKRVIYIEDEFGNKHEHKIPIHQNLKVRDGDFINAGDPLSDGEVDPNDILSIKGIYEFSAYLLNEIQKVYRGQGVNINDKHISIIVRQMLKKVRIDDVGDTSFVLKQIVDREEFFAENEKIIESGGVPAKASPALLGITKASLNIRSFISAASFQETTRVLTNAAIKGEIDPLRGLKENVIVGRLIPAGTGAYVLDSINIYKNEKGDIISDQNLLFGKNDFFLSGSSKLG